jgi:serine/threonine protein kinase
MNELVHPNLVTLYDLLVLNARWSLTIQLIHGTTFVAAIRGAEGQSSLSSKGMEAASSLWMPDEIKLGDALCQLAEGVSFLHRSGQVHRDLKPSNVLVTEEGRVVILDFGLAVPVAASMSLQVGLRRRLLLGSAAKRLSRGLQHTRHPSRQGEPE